ncbi:DUF397 domain-containing protein [Phytohabitans rumicis]|uniref:Transcriptional regulator n=1 Tax=Phytohabitans rumicis TaxID=1076125 RepID=A0A6V8L1F8_9ACTN|nr:DUF397 domain-containing protein [Phytohabitans rumicis]GFJ89954.1 transcriptional regulator [Phytohabitans rumicis]
MSTLDPSRAMWRKSSRSDSNGGACVEVADLGEDIAVRDSKNPHGDVLLFPRHEWAAFIVGAKDGEFDF